MKRGFISELVKRQSYRAKRDGFIPEFARGRNPQAKRRGFTLLELLVVIGIVAIVGVIAADIFANVTRSYNKADIITRVQRSGNSILAQMSGEIRNSRGVVSPAPGSVGTSLTIEDASGNQVTFDFSPAAGGNNGDVSRNGVAISDSDLSTGVNITNLAFTVLDTRPLVVGISLSLEQPLGVPGRIDFQAGTTMQTSVSLRTYE